MSDWKALLPKLSLECTGLKDTDPTEQDAACPESTPNRYYWCRDCLLFDAVKTLIVSGEVISGLRKEIAESERQDAEVLEGVKRIHGEFMEVDKVLTECRELLASPRPMDHHTFVVGDGGYVCSEGCACGLMVSPGEPGFEAVDRAYKAGEGGTHG